MDGERDFGKIFRALGDTHRLHILSLLSQREMNAGELFEQENIVQSTLSHHMKTLQQAGLVTVRRDGRWTYYSLDRGLLKEAAGYLTEILNEEAAETVKMTAGEGKSEKRPSRAAGSREKTSRMELSAEPEGEERPVRTEKAAVSESAGKPASSEKPETSSGPAPVLSEREKSGRKDQKPGKLRGKEKSGEKEKKKDKKKKHGKK